MNNSARVFLFSSAIVVVIIALVIFAFLMFKVYKIKRNLKNERIKIANEISVKDGEKKLIQRTDFGESLSGLKSILDDSIDHENVEICINSCIRNSFKDVLFIGLVGIYETVTLSNKANTISFVQKKDFDLEMYKNVKNKINDKYSLEILDSMPDREFDAIVLLNSFDNFDKYFVDYEKYLKKGGMMIIGNTKKNKKSTKQLVAKINEIDYKYDMLKWHNGFVIIVK